MNGLWKLASVEKTGHSRFAIPNDIPKSARVAKASSCYKKKGLLCTTYFKE